MQDIDPARLDSVSLFEGVLPAALRQIEQRCRWRRYNKNEQILDRDSDSRDVFMVVSGSVQVKNFSSSGREIALAILSEGEYFGELSAIDDQPRSASVIAAEKSLIASLAPNVFRDLLCSNTEMSMRVLKRLARIVRQCDDRIMDLSTLGAVQRVYVELLKMAGPDPAVPRLWSIYPMPTQADIAGHASTTRETVARVLSQLSSDGLVERKGRTLYIKERERLKCMADRLEREQRSNTVEGTPAIARQ